MAELPTARGTVVALDGDSARVRLADGSEKVLQVPAEISVAVGMEVTIVETGDSSPIFVWGK